MKRANACRIAVVVLSVLMLAPSLIGCAKKKKVAQPEPPAPPTPESTRPPIGNYLPSAGRLVPENDLGQFAKMYLTDASAGQPPQSLAAMPDVRRDLPKAYPAFEDGRYVVVWGTDPNRAPAGASQTVLAYEKATPQKGGVVAFLDGSVRNVTAQEFQTFAKSGAK